MQITTQSSVTRGVDAIQQMDALAHVPCLVTDLSSPVTFVFLPLPGEAGESPFPLDKYLPWKSGFGVSVCGSLTVYTFYNPVP